VLQNQATKGSGEGQGGSLKHLITAVRPNVNLSSILAMTLNELFLRSSASTEVDVLAGLQAQPEDAAEVALQRLTAKLNSKAVDPRNVSTRRLN
jgi:hypothetical protein